MRKNYCLLLFLSFAFSTAFSQPDRWQQKIKYAIQVDMNVQTNQFSGIEQIDYWNNSPDTLHRIFFHLYWNAFQPNSMMDVRSRELGKIQLGTDRNGNPQLDWDRRVTDRIQKLKPDEIGYQRVESVVVNGKSQKLIEHETILEVVLDKPILPKSKTSLSVKFKAQVPIQIRRSGRDNAEGVRYSMSQWYPKVVEYDYQGWNANPYIAREFYGVWGDFDVKITIDKNYVLGGTGYLQNANTIGFGYEAEGVKVPEHKSEKLTWHFIAPNVHDFMWAADPQYKHIKRTIKNGPTIHVLYKAGDAKTDEAWEKIADAAVTVLPFIEKNFGKYAYQQYSFIQGGDGGMEYPMATLMKNASLGTAIHEWMHSWYQMMLATNESLFAWMDEGFTDYATNLVSAYYREQSGQTATQSEGGTGPRTLNSESAFPHRGSYASYINLAKSNLEEPMTTHADHYNTNYAYSVASYSKGCVFLEQLGYIVGANVRDKILLEYYNTWRFKHPNVNDFIRIAEKISGMELDWYKEYFVYTTKTIDYAIGDISTNAEGTASIILKRIGKMPMPIDVLITYKDGSKESHTIPLNLMYGAKQAEQPNQFLIVNEAWKWTHPEYALNIKGRVADIKEIEIDPSQRLADINRSNNKLVIPN